MSYHTNTVTRRTSRRPMPVRRSLALVGGITALLMASSVSAMADNTIADGDNATPVAANGLNLGTVCVNSTTEAHALVAVSRNGSATGTNTFRNGTQLAVSVQSTSGSGLSASMDQSSITLPLNWTSLDNNTMSSPVSSTVSLAAGSTPGAFSGTVTYAVAGLNADNNSITRTGQLGVSGTISDTGACAPAPPDTTNPSVTVSFPSPVSGQNGWFNAGDVTPVVGSVTASDASNITKISCDGATLGDVTGYGTSTASGTLTVSGEGTHDVSCTATDGANNVGADPSTSSNTATVKIDTTAPSLGAQLSPANPAASGWYNISTGAPTVSFTTCSDTGSGLADACPSSYQFGEGSNQSYSQTISDIAGNSTTAGVSGVSVDLTAPSVSVTGVSDGAKYVLGAVPGAGCSTDDSLSGVDTPATVAVTGGTANGTGAFTATCSGGTDNAGNLASPVSVSYTVDYNFSGFLAPINNPSTVNTGKAGKTYPVKWQLTDANGNYVNSLSAVQKMSYKQTSCTAYSSDATDALETTATGGTALRYDSTANQYVYNWATPAKGCYTLFLTLDSGRVATAYFNLS